MNLDNLTARDIRPVLREKWHGWQAFRRGLATNLHALGVPAKVIQSILRHARVETTQKHYVIIEARAGRAVMKQLETAVRRANIGQQMGNSKSNGQPRTPHRSRINIG